MLKFAAILSVLVAYAAAECVDELHALGLCEKEAVGVPDSDEISMAMLTRKFTVDRCYEEAGCPLPAKPTRNFTENMGQPLKFLMDELTEQFYDYTPEQRACLVESMDLKTQKSFRHEFIERFESCYGESWAKNRDPPKVSSRLLAMAQQKDLLSQAYSALMTAEACEKKNEVYACETKLAASVQADYCRTALPECKQRVFAPTKTCEEPAKSLAKFCRCKAVAQNHALLHVTKPANQMQMLMTIKDDFAASLKECKLPFRLYNVKTLQRITEACGCGTKQVVKCIKQCFTGPDAMAAYGTMGKMWYAVNEFMPPPAATMCNCMA